MANEGLEEIEDAILAALEPLKSGEINARSVETYNGQLSEETFDEIITKLAVNFPAILVVYIGSNLDENPTYLYHDVQRWGVFVAAQNLRSERDARRGDGAEVGTYRMVKAVKDALTGNALGLGVQPLSLKAINSIVIADGLSVYALTFETDLDFQAEVKTGP